MIHADQAGFPAGAACLDGHFPGQPIVPGAMLLAQSAVALGRRGVAIRAVERMKFLAPLPPETGYEIAQSGQAPMLRLTWRAGSTVLARAQLRVAACDG